MADNGLNDNTGPELYMVAKLQHRVNAITSLNCQNTTTLTLTSLLCIKSCLHSWMFKARFLRDRKFNALAFCYN